VAGGVTSAGRDRVAGSNRIAVAQRNGVAGTGFDGASVVDAMMTVVAVVAVLNREAPCREDADRTLSAVSLQCEAVMPDTHQDDPSPRAPVADAWRLPAVTGSISLTGKLIVAGDEPWKHPHVLDVGYPWG
jgi:hypothetical protein